MILFSRIICRTVKKKRLLIIELNEFNEELLEKSSKDLKLNNIKRFLQMNNSETISMDEKEHFGLDPWVQWVSIHTGYPHEIHKIDHLADVVNLTYPQIWETLGEKGYSSGIWGAMNASRNNAKGCCFFLPDPWTYSEKAVPEVINDFLALPRYFSKNYLSISFSRVIPMILKLFKFITFEGNIFYLRREIFYSLKCLFKVGLNDNLLFSLFDLFSAKIFIKFKRIYNPDFSIIFLNGLAHAQHKDWFKNKLNKNMKFTIKTVDKILGIIFDDLSENDSILILNGLGQKNVAGSEHYVYRQNDPKLFLKNMKINFLDLEQCMTNESHVTFNNISELNYAFNLLKNASINGEKLFYVEKNGKNSKKLFFQLDYFRSSKINAEFIVDKKNYKFFNYFSLLAKSTGLHTPYGKAYFKNFKLKNSLYNHEINKYILKHFSS